MPQKLIADARGITNIKIGGGVEKRHGKDPQIVVKVRFDIPAGNVQDLGKLLALEKGGDEVRVHFYTAELQGTLEQAAKDAAAGMKVCPNCSGHGEVTEKNEDGTFVTPCHICHGTGKVAGDFSMTGVPGSAAAAQAEQSAKGEGEQTAPGGTEQHQEEQGGGDTQFEALGTARDQLEADDAAAKAKAEAAGVGGAVEPKRRGRRPKKQIEAGTAALEAGQPSGNNHHGEGEGQEEASGAGEEAAAR